MEGLPIDVSQIYNEIRQCFSVHAYTSVGLLCRKLIMHIAVDKEAEKNKSFQYYINYLEEQGYISTTIKSWADLIRKGGNSANHEIIFLDEMQAQMIFNFTMQLLRIIYEMEFLSKEYKL